MNSLNQDTQWMQRAIDLAKRGEGKVEPNPMVGCVLVRNGEVIGEGWHENFGSGHAEVNAIASSTETVAGATAYVTLEPCSHHGKTPPCCDALVNAGIDRVVVAVQDPNPKIAGQGIAKLRSSGIKVEVGLLADAATEVLSPYLKNVSQRLPWIIAKWAMTLDGKIATSSGDSQWISNEQSRSIVHEIRGRVDGILVGSGTAAADDPVLNARPAGARIATRIVLDSAAKLPPTSRLVQTAHEFPTLIACGPSADAQQVNSLRSSGCEVWQSSKILLADRLLELLHELADRGLTNVLVEGGAGVVGTLNDLQQIDEVHAFIGPKLLGGETALMPVGGAGHSLMESATAMRLMQTRTLDSDVYCVWRK